MDALAFRRKFKVLFVFLFNLLCEWEVRVNVNKLRGSKFSIDDSILNWETLLLLSVIGIEERMLLE